MERLTVRTNKLSKAPSSYLSFLEVLQNQLAGRLLNIRDLVIDKRNLHVRVIIDLLSAQLDHLGRLPEDGYDLVLGLAQFKRLGRRRRRVGRWRWWCDWRHRLLGRSSLRRHHGRMKRVGEVHK